MVDIEKMKDVLVILVTLLFLFAYKCGFSFHSL